MDWSLAVEEIMENDDGEREGGNAMYRKSRQGGRHNYLSIPNVPFAQTSLASTALQKMPS
jgi:hypothetical protein